MPKDKKQISRKQENEPGKRQGSLKNVVVLCVNRKGRHRM